MKRQKPPVIYVDGVWVHIFSHKWTFLGVFVSVFFVSFTTLSALGIAPSAFSLRSLTEDIGPPLPDVVQGIAVPQGRGELPVRIEIPEIGIDATVSNPVTTDIKALDRELLAGAVRYPGTGVLGEKGNVLLFGHSSHLPIVHNKAYKAFNDIQNLNVGDRVYVYGESKKYTYAVEKVEQANTTTGAIPLGVDGARITLATCDNFGAKSDRFVVTATLVAID